MITNFCWRRRFTAFGSVRDTTQLMAGGTNGTVCRARLNVITVSDERERIEFQLVTAATHVRPRRCTMVIAVVFAAMTAFLLVRALTVRLAAAGPRETASIKTAARPDTTTRSLTGCTSIYYGTSTVVPIDTLPPTTGRDRIRRPRRHHGG